MKIKLVTDLGETLSTVELNPKTFSTGSRGFHASFKAELDGKKYQMSCMAVEVGSKPKEVKAAVKARAAA